MNGRASFRSDALSAGACAVGFSAVAVWMWSLLGIDLFGVGAGDVYFDADIFRVYANLLVGDHQIRGQIHPLFALLVVLPVRAVGALTGLAPLHELPVVVAAVAALFGAVFYLSLRAWKLSKTEASVFTLLCAATGSALIFFPIVETFPFGAVSIVLCAFLVGGSRERGPVFGAVCLVFAYGITLTNIVIALLAIYFGFSAWKKRLKTVLFGIGAITVLTLIQVSPFFPWKADLRPLSMEAAYMKVPDFKGTASVLRSVFLDSVVMPEPRSGAAPNVPENPASPTGCVSLHGSHFGNDPLSVLSLVFWGLLLLLGIYSLASNPELRKVRRFLFSALAFNVVLHLFYGYDPFLFSLHWVPLLVLIASFSVRLKPKGAITAFAVLGASVIGFHNYAQSGRTRELIQLPKAPARTAVMPWGFELSWVDLAASDPAKGPLNSNSFEFSQLDQTSRAFRVSSLAGKIRRPALLIRSADALARDGRNLYVNYRWALVMSETGHVSMGNENEAPLLAQMRKADEFELPRRFAGGRGYAIVEFDSIGSLAGCIIDSLERSEAWRICRGSRE